AYVLAFVLLVLTAPVAAVAVFEPRRVPPFVAPAIFLGTAGVIFLAQYRALLVTTLLAIVVTSAFLMRAQRGSGIVVSVAALVAFVGALAYVSEHFPTTKFQQAITALHQDPWFFAKQRLNIFGDVLSLYSEQPRYIVTGTGPATYSSRAWRT